MSEFIPPILKRVKEAGFVVFGASRDYDLNIIAIRSPNREANEFDDELIVVYAVDGLYRAEHFRCTTDPGSYWLQLLDYKPTAILAAGQYRGAWRIGKHRGRYEALIQSKPVVVHRDGDKDNIINLSAPTEEGLFGINIHRANKNESSTRVEKWSAGCIVLNKGFSRFMYLCNLQQKFNPTYTSYSVTLLED
jgi:hypothetical protein